MATYEESIGELSDICGIIPEYYDIFGTRHVTSPESRIAILEAMGLQVRTVEAVCAEIARKRVGLWCAVLDPVTVISVHAQPHPLTVYLPLPEGREHTAELRVTVEDERGKKESLHFPAGSLHVEARQVIQGQNIARIVLPLVIKELGYYTISLVCLHPEPVLGNGVSSLQKTARLIIAPDACHMPEKLRDEKMWGVSVNLYALRSKHNWGIGDLGDLGRMVKWLAGLKAAFVGINPLHAIPNTSPFGISPYSPVSRLYRNFIYIDMEMVPEISEALHEHELLHAGDIAKKISRLKKSELIDYELVAAVKRELLDHAFKRFYKNHYRKDSPRGQAFRKYLQEEGEFLELHALFMVLSEYMRKHRGLDSWREWPEEYRTPGTEAVDAFRKKHIKPLLFFAYVQWLIDGQLADVSSAACSASMPIGLYGDLAIGSIDAGSDVWIHKGVVAEKVSVGAPPDDFNSDGQSWGFPPLIQDRLRESGYELFIQTIRKNMRHMGALRIDHALGLFRLYWVPNGMHARDGAYVRCNSEDLLRIIALESVRNRTLVIGEDLGTITDEARQALQRFGILSYRLFYFERNYPDPSFAPPQGYPSMSLCAVTTHDLPTLYGYWSGRDISLKKEVGIINDESEYQQQQTVRERDLRLILEALRSHGILPVSPSGLSGRIPEMTPELCRAVYTYLSLSSSKLVLVSVDDIVGTVEQQNLPGTITEYPNWRRKCRLLLEELMQDGRWVDLAGMFRNTRTLKFPTIAKELKTGP